MTWGVSTSLCPLIYSSELCVYPFALSVDILLWVMRLPNCSVRWYTFLSSAFDIWMDPASAILGPLSLFTLCVCYTGIVKFIYFVITLNGYILMARCVHIWKLLLLDILLTFALWLVILLLLDIMLTFALILVRLLRLYRLTLWFIWKRSLWFLHIDPVILLMALSSAIF